MHLKVEIDKTKQVANILNTIGGFLQSVELAERHFMESLTLCSEIVNNIFVHTPRGWVTLDFDDDEKILTISANDRGDGLKNIDKVLQEGYSTAGSLGIGIPCMVRLSNELFISTSPAGTKIVCKRIIA